MISSVQQPPSSTDLLSKFLDGVLENVEISM